MNLLAIQTEVLNHGFDPNAYDARIIQYINDAQNLVARRCNYYINEGVQTINTVAGTSNYAWPLNLARVRELFATDLNVQIQPVGLREIDRSVNTKGRPYFYALDGGNVHLYPTPDGIYPLELRYWAVPPALVNGSDVPNIPVDWHHMLWVYATWMCYESDDDAQMGGYWKGRFEQELAEFEADQKFISTEWPLIAQGMWDSGGVLSPTGNTWTLYGGYG